MQKRKVELIEFMLSCKCCDDKQNILVDNRAIKLEKIKNKIICDKCIEKRRKNVVNQR